MFITRAIYFQSRLFSLPSGERSVLGSIVSSNCTVIRTHKRDLSVN